MRRADEGKAAVDRPIRNEEPKRIATDEEVKRAADRAIERNREALTELARW